MLNPSFSRIPKFEVVIVNDGSTDTLEILIEEFSLVKVDFQEKNTNATSKRTL
jgi:glycosyltransferase involved in cell wall biosynthesis